MRQIEYADGTGTQPLNTAGTPYTIPIPAKPGLKVAIDSLRYTPAGTAHTAYAMRVLDRTTLTAAALSSQAVVNVAANLGATLATGANVVAANDWLVIQSAATRLLYAVQVSSVTALAITLTANCPVNFAAGDKVFFYGVKTDIEPETGLPHPSYPQTASVLNTTTNTSGNGLVGSTRMGEPILLYIDNVTAQGMVNGVNWLGVYESGSPISGLMGDAPHGQHPQEVLGAKLAGLPWGQILGGLAGLFGGLFGKILGGGTPAAPAPAGTTAAPTASPFGGIGIALAQWLASLLQQNAQQPAPAQPPVSVNNPFPPGASGS